MACSTPQSSNEINGYFDTDEFIEDQIAYWKDQGLEAIKTVQLNNSDPGVKEGIIADEKFLTEELKVIKEANISSISLIGKYRIDTLITMDAIKLKEVQLFKYSTEEKDLKVRQIAVYEDDFFSSLIATSNFMTSFNKRITYKPGKSLQVQGWQKTIFLDTVFYRTHIDFK